MVVAVTDPESCWEAFQASLILKRSHKRLNRTIIQAMIRERLELSVEQAGSLWHDPRQFGEGARRVESWMKEQLGLKGLELETLDLLHLPRCSAAHQRDDLRPRYDEFWLEDIATADGFQLNLSLVVRTWVPPVLAGAGQISWPQDSFNDSAKSFFGTLDAESCLSQINRWQDSLGDILEKMGDGVRSAWALMAAGKYGLLKEDQGIYSDATWVTQRQVRPSKEAFVPGQRYRFLDAYHLFFLLRNWQEMPERYRMSTG